MSRTGRAECIAWWCAVGLGAAGRPTIPDYTADRERRVLELLRATPVPAPTVVAADPTGAHCDVPALLLTRLPGHPPRRRDRDDDGFCRELATTLATIHEAGRQIASQVPRYRLYYDRSAAALASWIPETAVWTAALTTVRERPPPTPISLIHRDYHPENTLWSGHRVTGVVDWTQASHGPLGLDVGHMRWNLVADHGQLTADRFLASYQATTGRALKHQRYWDLVALFDLLLAGDELGDIERADLQRFEEYAKTLLAARE
jgi:aminoglycoside phosphotransferase (APT) family kinase protein